MKQNYHIEEEAEKIIGMMDEKEEITFDPYFFTRLHANMKSEKASSVRNFRQVMAFSLFMLFLLGLNVVSLESYSSRSVAAKATTSVSRDTSLSQIAKEYAVFDMQTSIYTYSK
jgi:predicted glycosyltransferase